MEGELLCSLHRESHELYHSQCILLFTLRKRENMSNYIRPNAEIRLRESDNDKVVALAEALHITPVLAQILVGRGLTDFEESKLFFNPSF